MPVGRTQAHIPHTHTHTNKTHPHTHTHTESGNHHLVLSFGKLNARSKQAKIMSG